MSAGNGHMKDWLNIQVDIRRAEAAAVGKRHGITPAEFRAIERRVLAAHRVLRRERNAKKYGFYDLYKDDAPYALVKRTAKRLAANDYDNLVILGIGGSALGITALNTALNPPYYNLLSRARRKGRPRLFVMDNIDPVTFQAMLRICRPEKTLFNVISKSGSTAEPIAQLMIVVAMLEKTLGKRALKRHIVVTTSPRDVKGAPKSLLHPVADAYGLTRLPIPVNVGGRFSVFTPVGMFPAAMLGMDIDAMRAGCAAMDVRCSKASLFENPAYLRAAVQYLMNTAKGKPMSVMMPYGDALRDVADWYRQLWAESLGKRLDLNGTKELFTGQTPVKALGATDQHSQVQLYCEGPNDKIFNILETEAFEEHLAIPNTLQNVKDLNYLRGGTMNKLMACELRGTLDALRDAGRPVIRVTLPRVNAYTVAQLLYMLEVETAMSGRLYRINAFDQPGVEAGKRIARKLMGEGG